MTDGSSNIIDIIILSIETCYEYNHNCVEIQIKNIPFAKSQLLKRTNEIVNIRQVKKGILFGGNKRQGGMLLLKEQKLNLSRDKKHPNSKIAIEVKTEEDKHIGYIYHQLLAHLMDIGKNLFAILSFVEIYKCDYRVAMEIFMRK
jgi:hypothetical protein